MVAAKAASALEINDNTTLANTSQSDVKTFLAQIQNEAQTSQPVAPGNNNTDSEEAKNAPGPEFADDDSAILEKITLLTDSALGGLEQKREWIEEKLSMYATERQGDLATLDEECRLKIDGLKFKATTAINAAIDNVESNFKTCRADFLDAAKDRKEAVKGKLQVLTNETITRIKELKVEEILNESGMPTDNHNANLTTMIGNELVNYNAAIMLVYNEEFKEEIYNNANDSDAELEDKATICFTNANAAFSATYSRPVDPTCTDPGCDYEGVEKELTDAIEECKETMSAFRLDVIAKLDEDVEGYVKDANTQVHIAKSDFINMINQSIKKLHMLNDLTEEQKNHLRDIIIA